MTKKRSTKVQIEQIRNQIRDYLVRGLTPAAIMSHLEMPESTFYWHMHNINMEDQKILQDVTRDMVGTEILQTRDRLLRTIRFCETVIADNSNRVSIRDKLDAERLKKETSVDLIRLLNEAPSRFIIENNKNERDGQPELVNTSDWKLETR